MTDRTIGAVLAAIVLGPFFGSVVATSGYAGLTILAFACFFAPLVVSLIADRRIILLALLPNPLLSLTWLFVVGVQHPEEQHFGLQTTISVMLLFAILAIPSLLVSVPIYLIRRFLSKERTAGH
jgi:1,4-dihydroxy-2-naphthoate octaprenyltransferase